MQAQRFTTFVFTAFLAITQLVACQGQEESQQAPSVAGDSRESSGMRITSDTLASLPANAHLRLEGLAQDDVIVFDPSRGPIDYARIQLVTSEQQLSMAGWLQEAARKTGLEVQALETRVLAVRLTADSAELVSSQQPGPQQQQRCATCCDTGYCCYSSYCSWVGGQRVCQCGIVACCDNPALR